MEIKQFFSKYKIYLQLNQEAAFYLRISGMFETSATTKMA